MRDVLPSGAKHGCHEEDLSGCLFFYVKEQLALFARRAREWGVRVHLTHLLVNELAEHVAREDPELAPFRPGCFDRVDLPGLIDQLQDSVHLVFDYCGPFLRRGNPHAALLVRMFRWHGRRLGARAWSAGIETSGHVLDTEPVEKFRREAAAYLVGPSVHKCTVLAAHGRCRRILTSRTVRGQQKAFYSSITLRRSMTMRLHSKAT